VEGSKDKVENPDIERLKIALVYDRVRHFNSCTKEKELSANLPSIQ